MTYDEREQRTRDYYAAVHTDRLLNSATAVMRKADEEMAELRARLAAADEAIARVEALAKVQAMSCQAQHRADHARNWLDVLAILEPVTS